MNKIKFKLFLLLCIPIALILDHITSISPKFTEKLYSIGFDKMIIQVLSNINGIFKFSVWEFIVYIIVVIMFSYIIYTIIRIFKNRKNLKKILLNFVLNIGVFISIIYFLFIALWGLNYNRIPFGENQGIKSEKYSKEDLENLYTYIVDKANYTRKKVSEDSNGIMKINGGYESAINRAEIGYYKASKKFPKLSGKYGKSKPIFASKLMNYTGITGIYSPFTGEPNINIAVPEMTLPATTEHEMAHQRGYASEDEANFIAYVTCSMHPDADFQYSGYILALIHINNALVDINDDKLMKLNANISDNVKKDLNYNNDFWMQYKGKVDEISSKINDTYLKSNGVEDGERSYGRMVDLLLSYYKTKGII